VSLPRIFISRVEVLFFASESNCASWTALLDTFSDWTYALLTALRTYSESVSDRSFIVVLIESRKAKRKKCIEQGEDGMK
jgi:hypothetical protein